MALRTLMQEAALREKKKQLEELRARGEEIQTRKAELEKREAEIAEAINEASTDEEKNVVEASVAEHEAATAENEQAARDNAEQVTKLEGEIAEIETRLKETEEKQEKQPEPAPADPTPTPENNQERKRGSDEMETRKAINGLITRAQAEALTKRSDVQDFLHDVKALAGKAEKRSVSGADVTIPTVVLDIIRENIADYSLFYKSVRLRSINGEGRQTVPGGIPEAVWTEACATLNELSFGFYSAEIDEYKVGGIIPVCNATLEDSDVDLVREIIIAIGQAIGLAVDKAILYGTGVKMPLGIMTRLAQTAKPDGYSLKARPWEDLHTTNIKTIASTTKAVDLFKEIILASGAAKKKYSRSQKFWAMNETTHNLLTAQALTFNASGAIVAGINNSMPVAGGNIYELDFIPDNVIICGYSDLYLLGERAGVKFAKSEHVKFTEDQTVFKGTARFDGLPVIAEGFVAIGLNGVTPTAEMTFATDTANAG